MAHGCQAQQTLGGSFVERARQRRANYFIQSGAAGIPSVEKYQVTGGGQREIEHFIFSFKRTPSRLRGHMV